MLHIFANLENPLSRFMLDSLAGETFAQVIATPARRRGFWPSLARAWESHLPVGRDASRVFDEAFVQRLRAIQPEDQVLFFAFENSRDLMLLRRLIRARRQSLFLWNPVARHGRSTAQAQQRIGKLKALGIRVCTFDPEDAGKYGVALVEQVYRDVSPWRDTSVPEDIDLFFVGEDKGRLAALRELKTAAEQAGLQPLLHILPDTGTAYSAADAALLTDRRMAYEENLSVVNRSRCLIEFAQRNQSGVTLRTLEALFFGKKLVTNLAPVRALPFYDPARVFIVGEDDIGGLAHFVHRPSPAVPQDLLAPHEFRHWCRQFL